MLQFNSKSILAFKIVKNDPKLSDLIGRIDKNIANLGTLSSKAFKYLTKMGVEQNNESSESLIKTYESLSAFVKKF